MVLITLVNMVNSVGSCDTARATAHSHKSHDYSGT